MKRKTCKHDRAIITWSEDFTRVVAARCSPAIGCGEYLTMGQANDDSEPVRIEIRAAELADTDNSNANEYESLGWATFYSDGDLIGSESLAREIGPGLWAGWLAAEIYESAFEETLANRGLSEVRP